MPKAGFEPARLAAPPPQDGVSASSTTSARISLLLLRCCGSRSALLLLLLRLILFRAFANHRIATAGRTRDENRQSQRRDHKDDRRHRRGPGQERRRTALSEGGLCTASAESSSPIRILSLLKQNDENQKNANDNVDDRNQYSH